MPRHFKYSINISCPWLFYNTFFLKYSVLIGYKAHKSPASAWPRHGSGYTSLAISLHLEQNSLSCPHPSKEKQDASSLSSNNSTGRGMAMVHWNLFGSPLSFKIHLLLKMKMQERLKEEKGKRESVGPW